MPASDNDLTPRQQRAVAALLQRPTRAAAASEAGVSERQLRRWLKDRRFLDAYRQARREAMGQAVGYLQFVAGLAGSVLVGLLRDDNPHVRAKAAAALLANAWHGAEVQDLADEVAELRRLILEKDLRAVDGADTGAAAAAARDGHAGNGAATA
jgi:hypothetical protein